MNIPHLARSSHQSEESMRVSAKEIRGGRVAKAASSCNKANPRCFVICNFFIALPFSSEPVTRLGYGILYGIFSLLCALLQRTEIRTDSLTKGHVKYVRQLREGLSNFSKAGHKLPGQLASDPRSLFAI